MMTMQFSLLLPILLAVLPKKFSSAFVDVVVGSSTTRRQHRHDHPTVIHQSFEQRQQPTKSSSTCIFMVDDTKSSAAAAQSVTGEELERMLQEWDTPLVVDAYATWCGPCLLMAPEFESAATSLFGKVRFVKLDTDLEPQMASRLGIMGLPTLLFLDKNKEDAEAVAEGKAPAAVLKERIEGALRKQSIVDLCMYHFFDGPMPTSLS